MPAALAQPRRTVPFRSAALRCAASQAEEAAVKAEEAAPKAEEAAAKAEEAAAKAEEAAVKAEEAAVKAAEAPGPGQGPAASAPLQHGCPQRGCWREGLMTSGYAGHWQILICHGTSPG